MNWYRTTLHWKFTNNYKDFLNFFYKKLFSKGHNDLYFIKFIFSWRWSYTTCLWIPSWLSNESKYRKRSLTCLGPLFTAAFWGWEAVDNDVRVLGELASSTDVEGFYSFSHRHLFFSLLFSFFRHFSKTSKEIFRKPRQNLLNAELCFMSELNNSYSARFYS